MKPIVPFLMSSLLFAPCAFAQTTVDETLQQAFMYSPALKSAQENRQAAMYDINKSKAAFYPTIGVWANTGYTQNADSTTRLYNTQDDTQGYMGTSLSLRQNLYAGGGNYAALKTSEAGFAMATNMLLDSATSLAFEAVSAHADLVRRYKLVELAQNNVSEHLKILETTRLRFKQGVITQGEVTQVESRLARAQANLLMHQSGLDAAKANYLRVVGVEAPTQAEALYKPMMTFATTEEAQAQASLSNPRLQASKDTVEMNIGQKKVAQSRFLPNVYVQGGVSTRYQEGLGNGNTHGYDVGLVAQWELFSGGADKANVSKADAKIRQAQFEVNRYYDQVVQDIQTTFSRSQAAFKQAEYYAQAMTLSKSTKNNFLQQFEAGKRGLLDVLDAEQEYYNSAIEKEINAVDALIGQYRLLALAGTLLDELKIASDSLQVNP